MMMMPRKKKRLYDRMQHGIQKKEVAADVSAGCAIHRPRPRPRPRPSPGPTQPILLPSPNALYTIPDLSPSHPTSSA